VYNCVVLAASASVLSALGAQMQAVKWYSIWLCRAHDATTPALLQAMVWPVWSHLPNRSLVHH